METVTFTIIGAEITPEIKMPVSATIPDLKKEIERVLDVAVARQTLRYNNQVLMNDQTLSHYQFGQSATLVLIVALLAGRPKFNIFAKNNLFEEEIVKVKVKETTSVAELKKKLGEIWICGIERITLYRLSVEMDNDLPLSKYYISEGSLVDAELDYRY